MVTIRVVAATTLAALLAVPALLVGQADTLGTVGAGVPGEIGPAGSRAKRPTGPTPRMANGRPDFNGVWEHAYVPDMSLTNAQNPSLQKGPAPLPYTAAGLENVRSYDPEKDGDYTGMCLPFGLMRSMNAPYPIQIMQNDRYVAFLFEQNTWFHVAPFRDTHIPDDTPTWFGDSIARWDGDTRHRHCGLQRLYAARYTREPAQHPAAPDSDLPACERRRDRLHRHR